MTYMTSRTTRHLRKSHYLLLHGHLPTQAELDEYVATIKSLRGLPDALKTVLEMIPADAHPMDVLRTGVSFLGNIEPEGDFANQQNVADRLLAVPAIDPVVLASLITPTACALKQKRTMTPLPDTSCTCLHDKAPSSFA